ncbi:hypothetical protein SDC9_102795 [bioreactor metagenome]|uniref:Uncharacterized protein n=1 Tax=bioreactor metagenome TaxID=1076179 RepID=A0A645ASE3_9ZZZZ
MGEQRLNRMKKIVSILLAVFFVATLTAVSASACNDRHWNEDDHECGDYDDHDDHCGDSYNDYGDGCDSCDDYDNYDSYDNYGGYDDYR